MLSGSLMMNRSMLYNAAPISWCPLAMCLEGLQHQLFGSHNQRQLPLISGELEGPRPRDSSQTGNPRLTPPWISHSSPCWPEDKGQAFSFLCPPRLMQIPSVPLFLGPKREKLWKTVVKIFVGSQISKILPRMSTHGKDVYFFSL